MLSLKRPYKAERLNFLNTFKVAIDGPSGAGKSTIARAVSQQLGFIYIDTGAMYRSVGYFACQKGADPKDESALQNILPDIEIDLKHIDGVQHIFVCGEDVSDKIRTPEMSMAASDVSRHGCVREKLTALQRIIADSNDVVMDGRDIGTSVLPDAQVKIFLTAGVEARAKRRFDELAAKGETVTFDEVKADIEKRDYNDSHREISPLKCADDAMVVDTTDLTLAQSIETVFELIDERRVK